MAGVPHGRGVSAWHAAEAGGTGAGHAGRLHPDAPLLGLGAQ
uniref:Aquaporin 12B n=1 Tax=Homo sapiens TaxID=9606 RepID=F2Z3N0_HUMAN